MIEMKFLLFFGQEEKFTVCQTFILSHHHHCHDHDHQERNHHCHDHHHYHHHLADTRPGYGVDMVRLAVKLVAQVRVNHLLFRICQILGRSLS